MRLFRNKTRYFRYSYMFSFREGHWGWSSAGVTAKGGYFSDEEARK